MSRSEAARGERRKAPPAEVAEGAINRLCIYDAIGRPLDYESTAERVSDFLGAFTTVAAQRLAQVARRVEPAPSNPLGAARRRWTIYVCEKCGGRVADENGEAPELCLCSPIAKPSRPSPPVRRVEVVPASSLSLALEALRELIPWAEAAEDSPEVGRNGPAELDAALTRARAVLDQLEEGERSVERFQCNECRCPPNCSCCEPGRCRCIEPVPDPASTEGSSA